MTPPPDSSNGILIVEPLSWRTTYKSKPPEWLGVEGTAWIDLYIILALFFKL